MSNRTLRVLIVEDSEDDALLLIRELKKGGYNPVYERVETSAAMKKALKKKQWDIILCDYTLPKFNARSALAILKEANIDIPIIIVSGTIGEETAIECMRLGAQDYIMKSNLSRLGPAIARELKEAEVRNKQKQAEEERRFRDILLATQQEVSIDGILVVDENNRILLYNRRFIELWKLPAKLVEDRIDEPVLQFVTAQMADPRSFLQRVQYLYEHRQETSRDELVLADGRFFDRYSAPMVGSDKRYFGRIWYFRDITERKRTEDQLQESEKKYKLITEKINDIVWIADMNLQIQYVTPSVSKVLGFGLEAIYG
ncbi:MAG: response regulator, partial [Smithella sp.]